MRQTRRQQIWNVAIRGGAFVLEHIKRMHHLDPAGLNVKASITCVLPLAQKVYTGDKDGKVVSFCPSLSPLLLFFLKKKSVCVCIDDG